MVASSMGLCLSGNREIGLNMMRMMIFNLLNYSTAAAATTTNVEQLVIDGRCILLSKTVYMSYY